MNSAEAQQALQAANQRWYAHGLDVELDNLGYPGERNDVATYLDGHGWRSVTTSAEQLLTDNGLPVPRRDDGQPAFSDNYYCTAVLHKTGAR
jgi:O-methyltransferase involved in polyketide biosynthesis